MKSKYLAIIGVLCLASSLLAEEAVVIANNSIKAAEISASDLRDVFSGAKSSVGGVHVVPVILKDGPTHESFLKDHIGKSDSAFRATWRSLVFTGQAAMPKTFDSDSALLEYVASTPGAIGYAGKNAKHDSVKTLAVK